MKTTCVAGDWVTDKREGQGSCLFADGTTFQGQWTADAWVQSCAEPRLCSVEGWGSARAVAGHESVFTIQVRADLFMWSFDTPGCSHAQSQGCAAWRAGAQCVLWPAMSLSSPFRCVWGQCDCIQVCWRPPPCLLSARFVTISRLSQPSHEQHSIGGHMLACERWSWNSEHWCCTCRQGTRTATSGCLAATRLAHTSSWALSACLYWCAPAISGTLRL